MPISFVLQLVFTRGQSFCITINDNNYYLCYYTFSLSQDSWRLPLALRIAFNPPLSSPRITPNLLYMVFCLTRSFIKPKERCCWRKLFLTPPRKNLHNPRKNYTALLQSPPTPFPRSSLPTKPFPRSNRSSLPTEPFTDQFPTEAETKASRNRTRPDQSPLEPL